jgi:hypothetical protein
MAWIALLIPNSYAMITDKENDNLDLAKDDDLT